MYGYQSSILDSLSSVFVSENYSVSILSRSSNQENVVKGPLHFKNSRKYAKMFVFLDKVCWLVKFAWNEFFKEKIDNNNNFGFW